MKHFLDLKSLIDSDYYKNNNRLHWHVEHLEYDKFTKDLYTWLNSIELFAEEKEIFDISSVFIYTELASYLTHVYDFVYLSEGNVSPIYSKESNVFIDKIWNKEVVKTSLLIELEKNKFRVDKLKQLYSFLVKIFPKKYVQTLVVSSNDLVEQYLNGTKGITLKIIPHYYFEINIKSSTFSKDTHPTLMPITNKLKAFGWTVKSCNGHNVNEIYKHSIMREKNKPFALVCNTIKGFPIPYMMNIPMWHYRSPNTKEYKSAINYLDKYYKKNEK